jgi:hypothetical protein
MPRRSRHPSLSLLDLPTAAGTDALPADVTMFLQEAERRIEQCRDLSRFPGFVPSDYHQVYHALRRIAAEQTAAGNAFCEWGSGFGVVACLAAFAGFRACGIEIEPVLVDAARELAGDFALDVNFHCDSYLPHACCPALDAAEPSLYLVAQPGELREQWGVEPDDFDVIFAYPGPDDDELIANVFRRFGSNGAILLTYHGRDGLRLRRKVPGRLKSSRRIA